MDEARETPIDSMAQALALLPDVPFLLLTIESPEGERLREDAAILRPVAATDAFGADPTVEYGDLVCLAFRWIETLQPMYTGHPGSVWPVVAAEWSAGDRVVFVGPLGRASLQVPEPKLAARLGGWADAQRDVFLKSDVRSSGLPINRKERFYTGTVLPMIVAGGEFRQLHRLLALCGMPDVAVDHPASVQFFTEYSFAESVFREQDQVRFEHRPLNADTPDVVLRGRGWLLAIEAKMYHRPNAASLNAQYQRQSVLIDYWAARFGAHPGLVRHVLLLPEALAREAACGLEAPVVTWESLLEAYRQQAPAYWLDALQTALEQYKALASRDSSWGRNAELKLNGDEIIAIFGAEDAPPAWVGRSGGVTGKLLTADFASDRWRTQTYEVRTSPPPMSAKNWFPVAEFLQRVNS